MVERSLAPFPNRVPGAECPQRKTPTSGGLKDRPHVPSNERLGYNKQMLQLPNGQELSFEEVRARYGRDILIAQLVDMYLSVLKNTQQPCIIQQEWPIQGGPKSYAAPIATTECRPEQGNGRGPSTPPRYVNTIVPDPMRHTNAAIAEGVCQCELQSLMLEYQQQTQLLQWEGHRRLMYLHNRRQTRPECMYVLCNSRGFGIFIDSYS